MPLARAFFDVVVDALFPVPPAERAVLAMGAAAAWKSLPRADRSPIPESCSIFSYRDERVSRLVWSIKYKKSRPGAAIAGYALHRIARLFVRSLPAEMRLLIVPMPVSRARRRERGFNQCDLILDEMERLDAGKELIFARDLLWRVRHTSRQTMKDRAGRLENIHDIFAVNEGVAIGIRAAAPNSDAKNYFVVVIDDVVTTGSTIRDAVATLRAAGFANTWGLSLAH